MKRHKALSLLSSDHHHGLRFAKKLISAKNFSDSEVEILISEFTLFYKSQLSSHFKDEEKFLAPALGDNPLIIRMLEDHKKMRGMFETLVREKNLKEELDSFGKFLEEHIRFEERELFPLIENTLSESMLEEISRLMEKRRRN